MAQEVEFADGGRGKVRSFGVGLLLTIVTLGIYYWFWYYFVNDELKDVGVSSNDRKLADSSPAMSLFAVLIGGVIIIPALISTFNYCHRIRHAQRLVGVAPQDQINATGAFLLGFPLGILIIPLLFHYWYVTKHQNRAVRGAIGLAP